MANLCTNPSFETDLSGWADQGTVTRTRVTTASTHGVASMRMQTSSTTFAGAKFTFDPDPNVVYSATFDIKGTASDTGRMLFFNGVATTVSKTFSLTTSGWERKVITGLIDNGALINFFIDSGAATQSVDWLIDNVWIGVGLPQYRRYRTFQLRPISQ